MQQFDRYYSLIFHVDDKLTEDANTMIDEQKNKSKCIRTILLDFVRVNGIVNNYTDIPEKERLERFFGCSAYSGKVANISKFVSAMKGYIMYLLTLFIQHRMEKRSASQSDINTVVKLT